MFKPKTHSFKLKVMLSKLQAVSNKVSSRCHASLRLDNDDLNFKVSPQLKKNVATFNAEVQSENVSLQCDEVTGLYEAKIATMLFELETQGTRVKIGQVQLNLGAILNEKKYRIVNTFPLTKCYDKTAKAKISVDFIPLSAPAEQTFISESKTRREVREVRQAVREPSIRDAPSEGMGLGVSPSVGVSWKQAGYKSRLAEQSNFILQEKLYEYEQKMDNYRLSQTQLQQKLHEQISHKDDQIIELTSQLNRKSNQIAAMNLECEQLKFRIKELGQELSAAKDGNRSLMGMVQNLQLEQQDLRKQVQVLKASLQNQGRTKETKEKHYVAELSKYTQRYLQSEQERNKIVFQLESKFKQEIEKKEANYRLLISNTEKKHSDTVTVLKGRIKQLESELVEKGETIQRQVHQNKKLSDSLQGKTLQLGDTRNQLDQTTQQKIAIQTSHSHLSNQLQTLIFSYHQMQRQISALREESATSRRAGEQLRMQLMMANQTIEEQRKSLTKYGKELQVHQERAYYLAERYNDDMEIKSQQEENIRAETLYYREELHKLKNQLRLAQEHADEEAAAAQQLRQTFHRVELQLSSKNQAVVRAGEERLVLQTQNRSLRSELGDLEQAVLLLKEENLQLGQTLRQKKTALQSDKSLQWSYKIEELQMDISQMVEKFKVEKDLLRDTHRREEMKRKEEIAAVSVMLKKGKEENEELRRAISRREIQHKDHDSGSDELRHLLKERTEEVVEGKEKMRIYIAEIQELEIRLAGVEERHAAKMRQVEQHHQRQLKNVKKAENLKGSYTKVISNLLEYLSKPSSVPVVYQQVLSTDIDQDIISIINISLKKFCDERSKIKDTIKRLQSESFFKNEKETSKAQFQQKRMVTEIVEPVKRTYFKQDFENTWKYRPSQRPKEFFDSESIRDQNQRLKRQISELRVKVKGLQDEVSKAERNYDAERYARETIKHEIQDLQEELEKTSFQLKRKEKLVLEYESEMKEMQTEILSAKSLQTTNPPKMPSRSEMKQREKEETVQNGRNAVVIRDLQARLEHKNKEYEQLGLETSRLRGEVAAMNQTVANLRGQLKTVQGRLKQKNAKVASQEQQIIRLRATLEQEYQSEILRQQTKINDLEESVANLEQEGHRAQQVIASLEKEVSDLQRKLKQAREQARVNENKVKKEGQLAQSKLKQVIQELQHSTFSLQSQIDQLILKNRQANNRIASLNSLLAKKTEEIDKNLSLLAEKSNEVVQLKEDTEERQRGYETKYGQLLQRLQELEAALQQKDYELEEYRFSSEGRLMDLEKRLQQAMERSNTRKA